MKIHNGMRPQDIVILLKIICIGEKPWQYRDLAAELFISASEISNSLKRSDLSGLINLSTKKVSRLSLMEFLKYGLKYTFPAMPGRLVKGVPTAHSHSFYKKYFKSDLPYVWQNDTGEEMGQSIEPLHPNISKAAEKDKLLYKLLAGTDILRVGRARETAMAISEIEKILL